MLFSLLATFGFLVVQALWILHWRRSHLSPRAKHLLVGLHLLFAAPVPLILYLVVTARTAGPLVSALVLRPTFAWHFSWLLASIVWGIAFGARLAGRRLARLRHCETTPSTASANPSIPRRVVLFGALAVGASTAAYALARTVAAPEVTRLTLPFPALPRELVGLRLLHLSDLHLGFYVAEEEVARVLEICRPLSPDLAVITGDLVDHHPRYALSLGRHLATLKVPLGWHATIGNHDIYTGPDEIAETLRRAGVDMLRDQHLDLAPHGLPLLLVGTDDPGKSWMSSGGPINLGKAMRGAPPGRFTVLLAHRPTAFDQVLGQDVALTLAGHTHGGQLSLPFEGPGLAHLTYRRPRGHYVEGRQHRYVSRGIGSVGLPFRLNSPPEVTLITLARA
jgi:uncharacterized protein